jgi:hypothetical protein
MGSCLVTIFFVKYLQSSFENASKLHELEFVEREHTYLANFPTDSSTTVVSIYVELNVSKHSIQKFDSWSKNFAQSVVNSPLVIFTDAAAFNKLSLLRRNTTTKFYVIKNAWSILEAIEKQRRQNYSSNYLHRQINIDPESDKHNQNLYILWNAKSFILHRIAKLNPFKSKFFLYVDLGSFRSQVFENWPDTQFITRELMPKLNNRMLLGQMSTGTIQGGFFGGSRKTTKTFYEHFFAIHDHMIKRDLFIGKDQNIMNVLAFEQFNDTVVRLRTFGLNCVYNNEDWFWFQV